MRILPATVAALTCLVLSGCVTPFAPERTPTAPSTTSTSPVPPPDPGLERAGRELTRDEAEAALPPLPKGATEQPSDTGAEQRTSDPAECVDVLRLGWHYRNLRQQRASQANLSWSEGTGDALRTISVSITSVTRPVGPGILTAAGEAAGGCATFSLYGRDELGDFDLRLLTEPRTISPVGEQAFAVRVTTFDRVGGKTTRVHIDQMSYRVGHNLVTVQQVGTDESLTMEPVEQLAADVLARLEQ